jgi:hypothetical protein
MTRRKSNNRSRLILPASILLLLLCFRAQGQQGQPLKINGHFDDVTIEEFVKQIEKQTPYFFYYNKEDFDSTRITINVKNQALQELLTTVFANTDFHFVIDSKDQVFLTKGVAIRSSVTPKEATALEHQNDAEPESQEERQKASAAENKLYVIGEPSSHKNPGNVTIAGYIRDGKTGEPVVGASLYIEKLKTGTSTDQYGYYAISLPKGRHIFSIQSMGMKDTRRQVMIEGEGKMNIEMQSQVIALKNVFVSSQKAKNIRSTQMGVQKLDIKTIKQVPVVFGEADVMKVVLTLPGVKSVGEASTGLNVRGGSSDQNLILFNDATIYNPSHFFGMFSAFNPEVVKDIDLYKSSIPARYGGRLSSVMDISSREGNKKNITGSAGIGLLTSRLDLEGPIVKDKSSFIVGGRSTYANWLLNLLPDQYKNSKAGFYDVNLHISHQLDKKNTIYLIGYLSQDRFNLNSDTAYSYGNKNLSLKWKHVFTNKFHALFSTGYDRYEYNISSDYNPVNAYQLSFDVNQGYFKSYFNYLINNKHAIEFGLNSIYYKLHPGSYTPKGKQSLIIPDEVQPEQALESALYISDRYNITPDLSLDAGIRYSVYNYLGPQFVNNYPPGLPKTEANIISTQFYGKGKFIKTYAGPEFRVSARYAVNESFSVKAGYNSQRQYINMISNTSAMAPTDIWKLSDPNIKPQQGDQVSIGLYKNLKSNTIETSVEVYYKRMKNFPDYKSGAELIMNHHIETEIMGTRGKAYGVELLIKKLTGKLNGWISYTYSRTLLQMNDSTAGEVINNGKYYPANYDKPHDVTVIGNFRVTHRFSLSLNTTYSTGRPITLPIGSFYYGGGQRTLYSDRNAYRIPDYFRMDFSMNIEGNHKVKQKTHNSWTLGVYNLTGRKNPYSVYFVSENGVINGYKLSIFGNPIPYINFNIRF